MIVQRDELYRIHLRARRGDKVLTTLLRQYTGIFSDYIFIEEATLAEKCDFTEHQVYHALKALNAERIIHYIPRKNVATVTISRLGWMDKIGTHARSLRKASGTI